MTVCRVGRMVSVPRITRWLRTIRRLLPVLCRPRDPTTPTAAVFATVPYLRTTRDNDDRRNNDLAVPNRDNARSSEKVVVARVPARTQYTKPRTRTHNQHGQSRSSHPRENRFTAFPPPQSYLYDRYSLRTFSAHAHTSSQPW